MDLNPFRLDIDDLINEFAEGNMTLLADMKRIWLSKKFSCIFEAKPNKKLGFFMQSLYAHCIGYMTSTDSISHRLGGLYSLYCLHETQPFKPPFRIYICLREMKRLKELVIDAKNENIGVVPLLVNNMLERNLFLYGAVDLKEGSVEERVNELIQVQNARIQHANKKLFADTQIERYIHMDMGKELEVDSLKKMSKDYAMTKELAIKAGKVIDTQDVNHIAKDNTLIGDVVGKTTEDWNLQKEMFYQKTGLNQFQLLENQNSEPQNSAGENLDATEENDDDFWDELEQQLEES
ncbi:putative small nuclear RNA activating complex (SNAPc), subunit SNAP43 [Helianthus annuus]|uniref:Small nuclear RNA activating complex (SNAPc), subunit SNAP43 n=1 Tax=Helianthus annuus TaxID=4232 RepID=A0A9K3ITB5_HELAN|nr:putative small nuclear RNA activating complex (SNAPc), subunit SNAP43 [Helianthus annuus]KAJ0573623.1 putative small nuclear RNA activating complex (SNAPc), subunit SNAP43 [Helianthus annuus]KAJ0740860.1 putative small nuclear RNA activating complex (SNAPc), subunit SNAP43 [Helianthus annuus]KAJ0911954.1 putative small nuclear RNA activating complex (SNAPc), subunit SNAP43 [Helianthus annuus]